MEQSQDNRGPFGYYSYWRRAGCYVHQNKHYDQFIHHWIWYKECLALKAHYSSPKANAGATVVLNWKNCRLSVNETGYWNIEAVIWQPVVQYYIFVNSVWQQLSISLVCLLLYLVYCQWQVPLETVLLGSHGTTGAFSVCAMTKWSTKLHVTKEG